MNSLELRTWPLLLPLQVRDDVVYGTVLRRFLVEPAFRAFRLLDLEIDARFVLHADDAQDGADRLRRRPRTSDDLTHIIFMHRERKQYPHLVNGPVYLHIIRI